MNLLVTGGAGFIGSNLIPFVIQSPEVQRLVNLDCLTYAGHLENLAAIQSHSKYVFENVDLRDQQNVLRVVHEHRITHVLHLAAESHVDRSIIGPGDFIHTNVVGTYHLLEACRQTWKGVAKACRFHHVSTDEVFGSLGDSGCFTESTPYAPSSPYSASKASSDMLVRAYHKTYGLPVVITNCSNNYGPYQFPEKLIPVTIQCLLAKRSIPVYGDGKNVRDWLFVRDHVEALWEVLRRGSDGQTYNIGGNNQRSNLELIEALCDIVDDLLGHTPGSSRSLISFVIDRPGHDRRYAVDATKLKHSLGWAPKYALEDGLRGTVTWYLENQDWIRQVQKDGC